MMRWCAIDTTRVWGSVALVEMPVGSGPQVVAEAGLAIDRSHTAHILTLLQSLLDVCDWSRDQLDAYAACRGPGTFTGARVGLSTIRGLALASGRPAYGIDRLHAMAAAVGPQAGVRIPLVEAGRGEVFGAAYDAESWPPKQLRAPWLGAPADACDEPAGLRVFFGSGAQSATSQALLVEAGTIIGAPRHLAGAVGMLAAERALAGVPAEDGMEPLYLRRPDAELRS